MNATDLKVRVAQMADVAAVDALLARSYPALLKQDYPPSVMVTAVPLIARAKPTLVTCGTYFVVEDAGQVVAAGGWTHPWRGRGRQRRDVADIRHVVTDHRRTRRGYGRALMQHIFQTALDQGVRRFDCTATRTAVPFYAAMGFRKVSAVAIPLGPGIRFPAVDMVRHVP